MHSRWVGQPSVPFTSVLVVVFALLGPWIAIGVAETPDEAIRRIEAGRHTPMPVPATAPASGPAGKGLTVENGTGHALQVHFSGPTTRTIVVPDGGSESVELAVGEYRVAAEVPGSTMVPFYGRQSYQPLTHYWLKFYTERVDPSATQPAPPGGGTGPALPSAPTVTKTGPYKVTATLADKNGAPVAGAIVYVIPCFKGQGCFVPLGLNPKSQRIGPDAANGVTDKKGLFAVTIGPQFIQRHRDAENFTLITYVGDNPRKLSSEKEGLAVGVLFDLELFADGRQTLDLRTLYVDRTP